MVMFKWSLVLFANKKGVSKINQKTDCQAQKGALTLGTG